MRDPLIMNYPKPLTSEDKSGLLPMKFSDYNYVIAFKIQVRSKINGYVESKEGIPPGLGTFQA